MLYFGALTFSIIVVLSVINYSTVRSTLLNDVREKQLTAFVKAAQSDLKSQLEKGMEASLALADDPLLIKWFEEGETISGPYHNIPAGSIITTGPSICQW